MWIVNPQGLLRHVTQPLSPALAENRRFEKPRGLTLHVTGCKFVIHISTLFQNVFEISKFLESNKSEMITPESINGLAPEGGGANHKQMC